MGMQMSEQLPDVTYWLALEISKNDQMINLDKVYQGSVELDYLYQLLTSKAQQHWWQTYGVQLNPVIVNNAFFRAVALLHERHLEFSRLRKGAETQWVKELLHLN
ncbi:hypothetical protein MSP8887_02945 [Marinomonas spartinae]|uniref:Uncharacterized protein n=2 Tax=Marinomonas spartinae TaxID=1792290 RepID=A0A1A8TL75_9GAMM|nr:hypothetical protein MSP8886_03056 [Marinomonas spartinae]SBS37501.1 hypothetical protein MSP8887_02945 [Marinomonas spartinae]